MQANCWSANSWSRWGSVHPNSPVRSRSLSLQSMIDGKTPVDADLDLRLARYFGMSEGFFMGLQTDYELLEAKRALNGELDRIVPRAA